MKSVSMSGKKRKAKKISAAATAELRDDGPSLDPKATKTDFDKREDRRSVNDVAMAPPTLTKRPKKSLPTGTKADIVPMAQKRMMDEERERVVARYRELKQQRISTMNDLS